MGINRADSAIGESNGPMLRQLQVVCNSSSNRRGGFPMPDWHSNCVGVVSSADSDPIRRRCAVHDSSASLTRLNSEKTFGNASSRIAEPRGRWRRCLV